MKEEKKKQLYKHLGIRYGLENQILKCVEELSELQKELIKYILYRKGNVIEEMADVEIMLEQLRYIFDIEEVEIEAEKQVKLLRQVEREHLDE